MFDFVTIENVVSLAVLSAGLIMFGVSFKRIKTGIGYKEFISSQYFYDKIDFGYGKNKKILLRRLQMSDIMAIGEMPNWIQMMMFKEDKNEDIKKLQEEDAKKTDKERIEDTKKYYDFLQKVAERAIVQWGLYCTEWKKVDPDFIGRLPDITLQSIFNTLLNNTRVIVKKKSSYKDLQLFAKNLEKLRVNTLKKMDGKETAQTVSL
jgi:hypothetical protein